MEQTVTELRAEVERVTAREQRAKGRVGELEHQVDERDGRIDALGRQVDLLSDTLAKLRLQQEETQRVSGQTREGFKAQVRELRKQLADANARVSIEDVLISDIDLVLGGAVADGGDLEAAAVRVANALGTGKHLLPHLADQFADDRKGIVAVALAGSLRGVTGDELAKAIAAVDRSDTAFLAAAGRALNRLTPTERLPEAALAWRGATSRTLRHASLWALAAGMRLDGLADALGGEVDEARLAIELLVAADAPGRERLLAALRSRTGLAVRRDMFRVLLCGPVGTLPATVQEIVTAKGDPDPSGTFAIQSLAGRLDVARRRELIAELLVVHDRTGAPTLIRSLGGGGREGRELLEDVVTDLEMVPFLLAAAARDGGEGDPRRATRPFLPQSGTIVRDSDAVVGLSRVATPVHVPFLLASLDRLGPRARVEVGARLWLLGHPAGRRVVSQATAHEDAAVRVAAFAAMSAAGIKGTDEISRGLADPDIEVAGTALAALDQLSLPLAPAFGVQLLARFYGYEARTVLAGLDRFGATRSVRNALATAVLDGEVADPDVVADHLFTRIAGDDAELLWASLENTRPAVRSRAVLAIGERFVADERRALRVLERLATDPDARVRCVTARALGGVKHDLSRVALVTLARDADPMVRDAAIRGLGRQESYHVIPVLRRALRDADSWVRQAARVSLLQHGVTDPLPDLLDDLSDPVFVARSRAALDRLVGAGCRSRADYVRRLEGHPGWSEKK